LNVSSLLDLYEVPNEPPPNELRSSAKLIRRAAREIVKRDGRDTIFYASPFRNLVESATQHAVERGYIDEN
jgi:hypothetical protein